MDWKLTCRVCLETGDMVSFFDCDEQNTQLSEKYSYCCGVEITKEDCLPTLICVNCVDRLTVACQFKQQCISANETLKECLEEFMRTSTLITNGSDSETVTVKQEDGMLLQYELPIEHDLDVHWRRTLTKSLNKQVVTKSPGPRKRGRPRKYPNDFGKIDLSPYQKKRLQDIKTEPEITAFLAAGSFNVKDEPTEVEDILGNDDTDGDPDFIPVHDYDDNDELEPEKQPKKRGRPRKSPGKFKNDDGVDVLAQETLMAYSEPIADDVLNPPKVKKTVVKKKCSLEKTHMCETCGQGFTSNASLQVHILRHLGIKPFVCSVCQYACVQKLELCRHMLRHTGVRPYKCRICDRRFGDFGSRQKHERLHLGIRPYKCTLCEKSFTYSYVLANHMLTHTGEKKYSCEPCNRKFTKAHHLKYHNKIHHKELYLKLQKEAEDRHAKDLRTTRLLVPDLLQGEIVDGTLQFIQESEENEDESTESLLETTSEQPDEKAEIHRAVAGMQAVISDSEFVEEEHKSMEFEQL